MTNHWRNIRSERLSKFSDFDSPPLTAWQALALGAMCVATWSLLLAGIAGFVWMVVKS